jgi:hypothetical protein
MSLFGGGRAMLRMGRLFWLAVYLSVGLSLNVLGACGLYVPDKNPLAADTVDPTTKRSSGGNYENLIVVHLLCETSVGLKMAYEQLKAPEGMPGNLTQLSWLKDWGTAITLIITAEDQSGLSPGLSLTTPFQNKVFTFPTGGNVTRAETH